MNTNTKNHHVMAIVYALLCVLAWSCIPVMAKLTQSDTGLDNYQLLFWSNLLSSLAVLPFALFSLSKKTTHAVTIVPFKQPISAWLFTALLGFLGCCFYYLCLYYGYARANSIDVLITQYTWPASMAILGMLILKERVTVVKLLGIALGFIAAITVISKGNFSQLKLGNPQVLFFVLLGATSFALFSVLSKRDKAFATTVTVCLYFVFATVFSWLALLAFSDMRLPPRQTLLPLILNGVLFNGLSYVLWIRALAIADASKIAPLVYLAPVLSVLWLVIVFREPFYPAYAVGIALSVFSGLIISREKSESSF